MPDTIGFIGLGIMGKPMASNLLKAGFPLLVDRHHQEVTDELVAAGARSATSPREIAAACITVITMLPAGPQVEEVLLGPDGAIEGVHAGLTVIDMSTISPTVTRKIAARFAEHDAAMLDAPVSGGEAGAIAGSLSIMVGGPEEAFKRCLPIFQVLGKTVIHMGESGAGHTTKACNQIAVALIIEAVSEALVLGSKAGLDPAKLLQVLNGGQAANRVIDLQGDKMLSHRFTPGGRVRTHHKDMGIILEMSRSLGVSLPVSALVDQMFASLEARGFGNLDHSALLLYLEELADHKVGETT